MINLRSTLFFRKLLGGVTVMRVLAYAAMLTAFMAVAIIVTYETIPTSNTKTKRFDVLIVLGSPPDPDGQPSSEERERVMKAVEEFRAGRASRMILTGGNAYSNEAEAVVMARVAALSGVPSGAVFIEGHSKNTIENIYFTNELMRQHGWISAEVVSSPSHTARVALIMQHYKLSWRTQECTWPSEYSRRRIGRYYLREVPGTAFLRWFGFRRSIYLPTGD